MRSDSDKLLSVDNLEITFSQHNIDTHAVKDISFELSRGQSLGVVGESGSGKSVTSLAILRLLSASNSRVTGDIQFIDDLDLMDIQAATEKQLYSIRGRKIAMIFQEPMNTLNPVRTCGSQVKEVLDVHKIGKKEDRKSRVLELFSQVQLPDVERIYRSYPHELSGGQLQRISIAMAISTEPDILICDEPTTALDVTVQKEILDLLRLVHSQNRMGMIFISHDLDVVADICDSVIVMYQGEIVEQGSLPETFLRPSHVYTKALLLCKPTLDRKNEVLTTVSEVIDNPDYEVTQKVDYRVDREQIQLKVENLQVYFPSKKDWPWSTSTYIKAVDGVSFDVYKGEILGIVGESGSGKSTLAKSIAGLIYPSSGSIFYAGRPINSKILSRDKELRKQLQLVFQDPYGSLNPQMTIGAAIREPLKYHNIVDRSAIYSKAASLLQEVGMDDSYMDRYPHQLSGGQRQRVCIARALTVEPHVLICDESVSALDVSIQAQILNLLDSLRRQRDLTILFISHDLSVVHYLCDRMIVMQHGRIVESGKSEEIILSPKDTYTKKLIESIPSSIGT